MKSLSLLLVLAFVLTSVPVSADWTDGQRFVVASVEMTQNIHGPIFQLCIKDTRPKKDHPITRVSMRLTLDRGGAGQTSISARGDRLTEGCLKSTEQNVFQLQIRFFEDAVGVYTLEIDRIWAKHVHTKFWYIITKEHRPKSKARD
ncbi:MAG: hypothetical protein ACI9VM_000402 [Candidatus Azotimanducaceae bacterium]|jgi:hypothetical protein